MTSAQITTFANLLATSITNASTNNKVTRAKLVTAFTTLMTLLNNSKAEVTSGLIDIANLPFADYDERDFTQTGSNPMRLNYAEDSDLTAYINSLIVAAGGVVTPPDPGDGSLQDITEFTSGDDRKDVQISPSANDAAYTGATDLYGFFKPEIKAIGNFKLYHLADKTQQGGFFGVSANREETGKSQLLSGIRFDQKNGGAQCKFATIASNAVFDIDPTMDIPADITPAMMTERVDGVIKSYWSLDNGTTWTRNTNAPDVAFTDPVYPFGYFDTPPSCVNGMQQQGFIAI